jgi:hypothetical protein
MSSAADRYEKKRESHTAAAGLVRRRGHRQPERLARELIGFVTQPRLPR